MATSDSFEGNLGIPNPEQNGNKSGDGRKRRSTVFLSCPSNAHQKIDKVGTRHSDDSLY